jgi:hypothetical protein
MLTAITLFNSCIVIKRMASASSSSSAPRGPGRPRGPDYGTPQSFNDLFPLPFSSYVAETVPLDVTRTAPKTKEVSADFKRLVDNYVKTTTPATKFSPIVTRGRPSLDTITKRTEELTSSIRGLKRTNEALRLNVKSLMGVKQAPPPQTGGRAVERYIVNKTGQEFARAPPQMGRAVSFSPMNNVPINQDIQASRGIQWDYTHPIPRTMYLNEALQMDRQPVLSSMYEFYKDNVTQMNFGNNSIPLYKDCPIVNPAESKAIPFGAGFLAGGYCDIAGVVAKNDRMNMPPITTTERNLTKKIGVQY